MSADPSTIATTADESTSPLANNGGSKKRKEAPLDDDAEGAAADGDPTRTKEPRIATGDEESKRNVDTLGDAPSKIATEETVKVVVEAAATAATTEEDVRRESAAGNTNYGRMGATSEERAEHIRQLYAESEDLGFVKVAVESVGSGDGDFYVPLTKIVAGKPRELTDALLLKTTNGDDVDAITDVDDDNTYPDFLRSIAKEEAAFLRYNLKGASVEELASLKVVGTLKINA